MIKVKVKPDRVIVQGHAGSGPKGHDLVCAAVSALVQAYLYTLQEFGIATDAEVMEGYVYIPLNRLGWENEVDLLTKSLLIGLHGVQEVHPECIKVRDCYVS